VTRVRFNFLTLNTLKLQAPPAATSIFKETMEMSMKASLIISSLFLVAASTSFAQGPRLLAPRAIGKVSAQDLNGPVLFGPEAIIEEGPEARFAPTPVPGLADAGEFYPAIADHQPVDPNAPGVFVPAVDGAPIAIPDCQCACFYSRVRYKNKGKIAPCAETMVVSVIDPCSRKYDCEVKCVQVKVCAPTCGCPKVKVSRTGRHTRFDYGKYAIDIYSNRNGTILVDYDA